jgi:hypothetical protein
MRSGKMTRATTAKQVSGLLDEAKSALSGVPGARAFTYAGKKVLFALELTDDDDRGMYALTGETQRLILTRLGTARIRTAYAALAKAGLTATDPAPGHETIAEGGNAEIIRQKPDA